MAAKVRLDVLLVDVGLAPTRARAQALIMAGNVVVGEHGAQKAGQLVAPDTPVRLKGEVNPYVGRGGLKLEAGLDSFLVDPTGKVCVDVGASTGGFTDCLLQHGAAKVYAIDVGHGQLAWKLVQDPRVINMERCNVRHLKPSDIPESIDLAVVDASFISLEMLLGPIHSVLKNNGEAIALVKPQFEVEKGQVSKGGVVREERLRQSALDKVSQAAKMVGFDVVDHIDSPIKGAKKGNVEYLLHLRVK